MKWIKDIFTESDGNAVCVAKVMAVAAFISFLTYAGYGLYLNKTPDLSNFANGLMVVLIGSGAVIAGKNLSEK